MRQPIVSLASSKSLECSLRFFATRLQKPEAKSDQLCTANSPNLRFCAKRRRFSSASTTLDLQEVPDGRGPPYIGSILTIASSRWGTRLHEYVDQKHKEFGPIYRGCAGQASAIFVSSPELFQRIFRLEGVTPKHFTPEAWLLYNQMRSCRRGLFFM